jgi:hypothetical protein
VYAFAGLRILWFSLPSVAIAMRDYAATASGGLGAVSVGVDAVFEAYALLVVASIVANVMLLSWVRSSDGTAKALHRVQRWSILLAFVVMIAGAVGFTIIPGPMAIVLVPMSGAVWGVEFVLTAALLGMYAAKTARTTA